MIITIGNKRIEVSGMAEVRQLTLVYKDDAPAEKAYPQPTWGPGPCRSTSPTTLIVVTREGQYWRLDEDGSEEGEMLPGIYDVTDQSV